MFLFLIFYLCLFFMFAFCFAYSMFLYCFFFCIQLPLSYFCTCLPTTATGCKPSCSKYHNKSVGNCCKPHARQGLKCLKQLLYAQSTFNFISALNMSDITSKIRTVAMFSFYILHVCFLDTLHTFEGLLPHKMVVTVTSQPPGNFARETRQCP